MPAELPAWPGGRRRVSAGNGKNAEAHGRHSRRRHRNERCDQNLFQISTGSDHTSRPTLQIGTVSPLGRMHSIRSIPTYGQLAALPIVCAIAVIMLVFPFTSTLIRV